jgi:hypothetical protein
MISSQRRPKKLSVAFGHFLSPPPSRFCRSKPPLAALIAFGHSGTFFPQEMAPCQAPISPFQLFLTQTLNYK